MTDNISRSQSRRTFLQNSARAAGGLSAAALLAGPTSVYAAEAKEKVNCVVIGCGGRGQSHIGTSLSQNLVAIVDADEKQLDSTRNSIKNKNAALADKVQTFTDYRTMFDKLGKQIDAVFIATPNHQHALPSLMAMQLGIGVYCEKPLCHTVDEARQMSAFAAKYKVPTQMGNQGHCDEGYRRLCEYVWAGAIGKITETHSWSNRANGGIGARPPALTVPTGLNWDSWIGPAPFRDYHVDLHKHEWHGWYDFGNGSLGNMGCHVLDGVYWALKLEHPTTVEVEQMSGGTKERLPTGTRIRWDFPARGDMPALKAYWYDGRIGVGDTGDANTAAPKGTRGKSNVPPLLTELVAKYPEQKFDSNGTIYVGEKGMLYTGTYGGSMRIVSPEQMKATPAPAKTLPRPSSVGSDFLRAVREGKNDTASHFDYSAKLTEFTLLGNLAQRAGVGNPVQWDGPNMRVTNLTDLNQWVKIENREGWRV
ncbi:Inositol 2-dehydrogenase/D-chiro-inositol 3-dehydrogenase [Anatilimnocola aggregata]|uniref:Inositol 2-dehydrogenase/D-chiro-inositol 3-dehydrogenase n=1 Tax=Anatilimnocola aggregata TaxID=2528021 RepID=A0A517Y493_9BACT|nr:Gfo/Idh/MocA family oxidoreductase [Anatilimnocola aggregata]QDU25078.1 Inositol 2-dehydrogenase/D-chiro-inositol 3-dehydrogenase [Anatilimnocola aggregata]